MQPSRRAPGRSAKSFRSIACRALALVLSVAPCSAQVTVAELGKLARDRAAREMFKALVAIRRMTDGSQPKDYPGALMVVGHAIRVAVDARIALPAEA